MIEGRVGRRYARAVFQLAREKAQEEDWGQQLGRFTESYNQTALKSVLNNPALALESRKKVVVEVAGSMQLDPLITRFITLLTERRRLSSLPSIRDHYQRLLDEVKGRVRAAVLTPNRLEGATLEKLTSALQQICKKEVLLKAQTDPGLIGGLVIELEGKIYDGSILTQLEKMKQEIEQG